jgi:3-oxoacyl-[acyl-carrier-protein] synthase III
MRFKIENTGFYAPPRIETAQDLSDRVGRSEQWILSRTGVAERRISDEPMSVMGAKAARQALGDGPPPDLILNASLTPMQLIPDSSIFIQKELGFSGIPSFSIHATCMSFLVALHTAGHLLQGGAYKRILIVSAEQGSVSRDMTHPESAALIGDGAAAALLVPTPEGEASECLAFQQSSWPEGSDLAEFRGAGTRQHPNDPSTRFEDNVFRMRGPRIYKMTVPKVQAMIASLLDKAGWSPEDVDTVIPHQASMRGVLALDRAGFHPDQVVNIVGSYGNTIAASIPMALAHAHHTSRLKRGDKVIIVGMGAGLHVAGALLLW